MNGPIPKTSLRLRDRYIAVPALVLLAALVLALYWPVTGFDFIAMDDNMYVVDNPVIQRGFSGQGILWSLTTFETANWHPLTWLSLMADYRFYGLNAAGYHVSNLLLHILNTLLLFFLLRRVTGETGKSLTVAALFGIHPLNIESVAWIAERKNLLSTLFLFLTLHGYFRYLERPQLLRYLQVLLFFALGLMAKPMLVTLPILLLLLDCWPLRRCPEEGGEDPASLQLPEEGRTTHAALLKEKLPFFLLSFFSIVMTLYAAKSGGAVRTIAELPVAGRIAHALFVCHAYLQKMIWPMDLAIFYPYPNAPPAWPFAVLLLSLIVAVTVFALRRRRTYPYLVVGWSWYLVTLLPVIGIVQVGFQSMANRYMYVPLIGIFIIIAWGGPDLLRRHIHHRYIGAAAVGLILILSFSTWAQLPHWQNSEAAFRQAIRVTRDNFIALHGLGDVCLIRGDLPTARRLYLEALRIRPQYAEAHNNLGILLMKEGKAAEAEAEFREALRQKPVLAEAHGNLGVLLVSRGKSRQAAVHFVRALELKPDYAMAKAHLDDLRKEERDERERIEGKEALPKRLERKPF